MTMLFFNSNSIWFETREDNVLGTQIHDGDLFAVRCECHSWPVGDLHQEWGVSNFPEQPALRITYFNMQPEPDSNLDLKHDQLQNDYRVLLHPITSNGVAIPVVCDSVSKQFFGVATDQDSAGRVADSEGKLAWITLMAKKKFAENPDDTWWELTVNRQSSDNWARAEVRFEKT